MDDNKNIEILNRFKILFSEQENSRIERVEDDGDETAIVVNLHGLTQSEAKKFINNIIAIVRYAFKLVLIHGYTHGTKLKEMITGKEFTNKRIKEKKSCNHNMGLTYIMICSA